MADDPDSFLAPMDVELLEKVVDMVLDSRYLDSETGCDLFVGEILIDEIEDLALPNRQKRPRGTRLTMCCSRRHASQETSRYRGRALQFPARGALHYLGQILERFLPSHEAGDSGLHTRKNVLLEASDPQRDNGHVWIPSPDLVHGGETFARRDVEENDAWF